MVNLLRYRNTRIVIIIIIIIFFLQQISFGGHVSSKANKKFPNIISCFSSGP